MEEEESQKVRHSMKAHWAGGGGEGRSVEKEKTEVSWTKSMTLHNDRLRTDVEATIPHIR